MDPSRIYSEFPAPSYQGHQKEALGQIKSAFATPGVDVVLVQAPTGSGKSLLARAIAGCATPSPLGVDEPGFDAYYTSPQVSQIDDVAADEFLDDMNVVYGKSNYQCILPRHRGKPVTRAPCSHRPNWDCPKKDECPYFVARDGARTGGIAAMTLAYFLEMAQTELFGHRDVLVVDEAHGLPEWAEIFASIQVGPETIPNWDDLRPTDRTLESLDDLWLFVNELTDILIEWRAKFRAIDEPSAEEARLRDHLGNLVPDLEWFLKSVRDDQDNTEWVFDTGDADALTLKPLHPERFLKYALWDRAEHIALLSATFLDKVGFCQNVGISPDSAALVEVPHSFPVENRPLYDVTQGKMTNTNRAETLPKIADALVQLMSRHRGKGLVHCHSYSIQSALVELVRDQVSNPGRIWSHDSSDRNDTLESWKESGGDGVFFSVKMEEALDLKYDLCRWQALCKAPFKHTSDSIVAHRLEENGEWGWYYRTALRTLIQACGRAVRQADDFGATYILDSSILDVFDRARDDMPKWFAAQVDQMETINQLRSR